MITTTQRRTDARVKNALVSDEVYAYFRPLLYALQGPSRTGAGPMRSVGITSCARGEGVTTVALHLALAATRHDRDVVLVDCNLAWPSLFRRLAVQAAPGLSEVALGAASLDEAIQSGPVPNMSVITAGARTGNPDSVFESKNLPDVLSLLTKDYDLVILDLPPIDDSCAAATVSRHCDGIVLAVEAERVRLDAALKAKQLLARSSSNLIGTVMTKYRNYAPNWL